MRPEEKVASNLLEQFLRQSVDPNARCEEGADPPDICCVAGGERLAVEVTRVNQQLLFGNERKARSERDLPLLNFGEELGIATEGLRERNYLLTLYGLPDGESWHRWKGSVTKSVVEFVRSKRPGSITFSGGELSSHDDGEPWLVAIAPPEDAKLPEGHPLFDIAASVVEMLRHALEDKSKILASQTDYDQRVLLLLNTYFFGDDIADIKKSLTQLIQENTTFAVFDSIFYETGNQLYHVYEKQHQ